MRHGSRPTAVALALLSTAVLGLAGCAGAARQAAPLSEAGVASDATDSVTRVVVENDSEWDLRIFVLVGGTQHYLGSLQGFSEASFEVPSSADLTTTEFRLAAKATGPVDNYYSNTIIIEEGDTVRWTVMRSLVQTRGTIRVL